MRYFACIGLLALLSGALSAEEIIFAPSHEKVTVVKGVTPKPVAVPTEGRHRTLICEEHGCGCGCLRGGACLCHPGWEKSDGSWYFYRERGVEKAAFDSRTNKYWRKGVDGKWVEWLEDVRETRQLLAPVYRANRVSRSC